MAAVGIVAPYQRREAGHACVQLARHLDRRHAVSILTPTRAPARLAEDVDRRVVAAASLPPGAFFGDWLDRARPALVAWTVATSAEQVLWARRRGVAAVLVASCLEDEARLREVYPLYDLVLAPSRAAQALLEGRYRMRRVVLCPWSPLRAVTTRPRRPRPPGARPRVYLPLGPGGDAEAVACDVAATLLGAVDCDLLAAGRGPLRRLRGLRRVRVDRRGGYDAHLVRMAEADLVIAPSKVDPFAGVALAALHMGAPFAGFDVPVHREVAEPGVDAVLAPHDAASPAPTPADRRALALAAAAALCGPRLRPRADALAARHAAFAAVWDGLLTDA